MSRAWAYHVYIINPDDEEIYVEHIFYGDTKDACKQVRDEHLGSCEYFRAAHAEGRTDERWEEIDREDLPTVRGGAADDDEEDVIDV